MSIQVVPQAQCYTLGVLLTSGTGSPFISSTVDLYTNVITLTPQTAFASLTIASFTGYSTQSLVSVSTVNNGSTGVTSNFGQYSFVSSANQGTPETIQGVVVSKSGAIVFCQALDNPVPIVYDHDACVVDVSFNYSGI
jgi:hypothetical protein